MLEVGKKYDLVMLEWGDNGPGPVTLYGRLVESVEGPVVKFVNPASKIKILDETTEIPEKELIVNMASLYFVSAEPSKK